MPTYTRHCNSCDEIFDVSCKIAEKELLKPPCPYCDSQAGEWRLSAPHVTMHGDRFSATNKPNGFKEVIQKIQERNPRTSISER